MKLMGVSRVAQAIAEIAPTQSTTKFFVSPTNRSSQQWQTATSEWINTSSSTPSPLPPQCVQLFGTTLDNFNTRREELATLAGGHFTEAIAFRISPQSSSSKRQGKGSGEEGRLAIRFEAQHTRYGVLPVPFLFYV